MTIANFRTSLKADLVSGRLAKIAAYPAADMPHKRDIGFLPQNDK